MNITSNISVSEEIITKSLVVAIAGLPNAGKSTLINHIIGEKIAAVTPKEQTTRESVRGIYHNHETGMEMVFVDTPGIFSPRQGYNLEKVIVQRACQALNEVDVTLFVTTCGLLQAVFNNTTPGPGLAKVRDAAIVAKRSSKGRFLVIFNKMDLMKAGQQEYSRLLLEDSEQGQSHRQKLSTLLGMTDVIKPEDIFFISANNGSGVTFMLSFLMEMAYPTPWSYDDVYTDSSERKIAEEITREVLYLKLHQELPYTLFVETEQWLENPKGDGVDEIYQAIIVKRPTHKQIVVGQGGKGIKQIGESARKQIAAALKRKLRLFLYVKVREDWLDNIKA